MAALQINTEADRLPAAITYTRGRIEALTADIAGCDYTEDVNGRLEYAPGSYAEEKRDLERERRTWEIMLDILTRETPTHVLDW